MRELYDRLIGEGEAGIDRLIAEQVQETLQLDFKRKEVDRNGEFSTNDRQILAQALSGFANSAGGLLVVGVDARPGPDRVDCAQAPRPISEIRRFFADAQTEVGRLVQPRLDGVSLATIESLRMPGAGYLLVHVERSERRPHRSEAKGQKGYFKRHGSSFFEMEHYDIEDAFSRSSSANLRIALTQRGHSKMGDLYEFAIHVELYNEAYTAAKYPYIVIDNMRNIAFNHAWNRRTDLNSKFENGRVSALAGSDLIVHAVQHLHMLTLQLTAQNDANIWTVGGLHADDVEISFDYVVGCENGRRNEGRFVCPAPALIKP